MQSTLYAFLQGTSEVWKITLTTLQVSKLRIREVEELLQVSKLCSNPSQSDFRATKVTIIVCILLLLEWWLWRKILFLQEVTKLLLDVGGKKSIFMRIKIDSSNFSTVSCLDKTLACSGLSFFICEMLLLTSSLPGTWRFYCPTMRHCIYPVPTPPFFYLFY